MALDFPASPSVGQIFTSGGASFIWDGSKWKSLGQNVLARDQNLADLPSKATALSNLGIPTVYMAATRNQSSETLAPGLHAILGSYLLNRGGWGVVGGGNTPAVPVSGMYRITNRLYINGNSQGARIGIAVNNVGSIAFVNIMSSGLGTDEGTELAYLAAGSTLHYNVIAGNVTLYTAQNHTVVTAELIEAY